MAAVAEEAHWKVAGSSSKGCTGRALMMRQAQSIFLDRLIGPASMPTELRLALKGDERRHGRKAEPQIGGWRVVGED